MNGETFKKRAGCTDRGKDYEHLYVSALILKLILDVNVKNFQISSNDDNFAAFDDVVVQVEFNNGNKQTYAIQLKHVSKGKCLTKSGLVEKRGNFSISKYFTEFKKVSFDSITFILFTNLKFDVPDNERLLIDNNVVLIKNHIQESILGTGERGRCYQFVGPGTEFETFFADFYLYTNQASVDKLKNDIQEVFTQRFKCSSVIFDQYLQFVTDWSLREGTKDKLSKNLMIGVIVSRLLTPDMVALKFCEDILTDNCKIFREALVKFPVTCFHECHRGEVVRLWRDAKNNLDLNSLNKVNAQYQVTGYIKDVQNLSDGDCTKLLWLMGVCPLPVYSSDTFEAAIDLCPLKFILFGETQSKKPSFRKLEDLDPDTNKIVVKHFKLSLQGKEAEILQNCDKILPMITTNELVEMLEGPYKVGKKEILPIPHIDRMLTRNTINLDFLNHSTILIIITQLTKDDEQKIRNSSINKINLTSIIDVWKIKEYKDEVFVSAGTCSQSDIEGICRILRQTHYHHFRMFEGDLEWVRSSKISDLKEFRGSSSRIEQSRLFNSTPDTKINIVCADPGMGKSILMRNLKNSLKEWTVLLQPKDHSKYFRVKNHNVDDFLHYVVDKTCQGEFMVKLVKCYLDHREVVFIWDGLDEVAEENLKVIFDIIHGLSERGYVQWLTSRCNLKNDLESEFGVLARTIEQFDSEQQNVYIEKRLNCSVCDLQDIKEKIFRCIKLVQYNDILGIPLQIYMFTELFRQNPDKYRTLLSSIFSITDLYRHFVDEKFNIYHQIKANLDDSNDMMVQIMERSKNERLRHYEEAALKTYLRPAIFENLRINCDAFLESVQSGVDSVGIIVDVTDEKVPSFLHNSYGEYFAACYLCKHHSKVLTFSEFIFEESYNNIRFLFDLLMAEECPAHIAVLYKNISVLQKHQDSLQLRDRGGRSPLHLASSWGRRFPAEDSKQKPEEVNEDAPEYQKILHYLSEKCDPWEVDGLFHLDSFHYADRAACLLPILVLSNKHRFDFTILKRFSNMDMVVLNAVKFDYAEVFENIPFITRDKNRSLLHTAVANRSINSLKKMLANPEYISSIDSRDPNDLTPLLLACRSGHLEIAETLINRGANIDATTSSGFSAIYLAAKNGRTEVVQLLLNHDADINAFNQTGQAALHLACEEKLYPVVQQLIDFGADINLGDLHGYTPLYLACRHQDDQMIQLFLDNDVDVNIPNHHGDVPLFMASWSGQVNTAQLLIRKGADVNATNKRGHGPIHVACMNKHLDIIKLLIEEKVDVNAPNKCGQTPLHLALRFNEGLELLLKAGADVEAVNGYGENFLDRCRRYRCYHEVVDLIIRTRGSEYWNSVKDRLGVNEEREEVKNVTAPFAARPKRGCHIM